MDPCIWKKTIKKNAYKKAMRSCDKNKGRVCAEEGKSVSIVEGEEREGMWVYQ